MVLLDEIEKAHPDVFNVLLQVLDDGRLTDGQGRTVDFTNAVLIMTSNLAGDPSSFFKPEFLNRVDEIILFRKLAQEHMGAIVDIQIQRLAKLLADRRMTIELDGAARDWLAAKGYDPAYGARPLKRVIQKELQDPLARMLLEGGIKDGDTVAVTDLADEQRMPGTRARAELDAPPARCRRPGCRCDRD